MRYTAEIISEAFARQNQMMESQAGDLQTYQVIGEEIGGNYKDGTPARNWYVLFQYPNTVKKLAIRARSGYSWTAEF